MSITDTPSPSSSPSVVSRPVVRANASVSTSAQLAAAWQGLGRYLAHIHHEVTHERSTDRLCDMAPGLFTALAAVGVPLPGDAVKPTSTHLLTEREREVLLGISQGQSNAEIARELCLSEDTIKTHARRMYRKLDARDRAHAVAEGFRRGLLT